MCTVSFIPISNSKFIFTSNRDESPLRNTIVPEIYQMHNKKILFPKDEKAGGTWIGVSENKQLVCLLNGGFTTHKSKSKYRKSRGLIVLDLLTLGNSLQTLKKYDLTNIEPFTVIMVDWKNTLNLYEGVWDGSMLHIEKKPLLPIIWSSSLLYSKKVKKKRNAWFTNFINTNSNINENCILHFHKTAGENNKETSLIMDKGFVKTKSITQVSNFNDYCKMTYEDLMTNTIKTSIF